jgi:phage terminase large subunit
VSFNPRLKTDATYQRFVVKPPTSDRAVIKKVGWRDNPWFPQVLKDEMEADKANDYEMYLHVWEGELRQYAENAIYAKQLREAREQGRILSIPIAKDVPVNTFWDLGKDDHTAIWLHQQVGPQNRFIGYYQNRLEELPHYAKWVLGHQYIWGHHYLPHDVEQDILGMAKTRKQQLEDMGIRPITVVPRVRHLNEGIEQTRRAFAGCWFEQDRCEQGLEALANYERKYDDENDTHSETPIHNWASNGADAFRQFGQGYQGSTNEWERFVKTETTGYSRRSRVVGVDRSWAE